MVWYVKAYTGAGGSISDVAVERKLNGMRANFLQIWQIADTQNRGLLTPSGFGVVLRLIGHAQAGRAPTEELALQRMLHILPKFLNAG